MTTIMKVAFLLDKKDELVKREFETVKSIVDESIRLGLQWTVSVIDLNEKMEYTSLRQFDYLLFFLFTHSEDRDASVHPELLLYIQDLDADHRVSHDIFKNVKVSVLYDGAGDCIVCDTLQMDLTNLGASELLRYDFGHCTIDKSYLSTVWIVELLQNTVLNDEVICVESGVKQNLVSYLRSLVSMKTRRKLKVWLKERELEEKEEMERKEAKARALEGDVEDLVKEKSEEMITREQRAILTKQGYAVVGSHSAVKLCRWSKTHLRGNGACYKHTFYGLNSASCMEATPSLACANRCLFCWRHHSNPTGRSWRWKVDSPEMVYEGMVSNQRRLIRQFAGCEGVKSERVDEALALKHCALSLVGEPIMYPHIDQFIDLLHSHGTSSFLVTNAQFPEEIRRVPPVTQFYISLDGSTKEGLKKLDRPLFRDYWERFNSCVEAVHDRKERTVLRLTLVKGYNMEDVEGVSKFVKASCPSFVELKGMTFSGQGCMLTMANCPWYSEVVDYAQKLNALLDDYEISCEHEHSCSVLLTHKKFFYNGVWHTWIDFDKFQELYAKWKKDGTPFDALDYSIETPAWAVYGSTEQGFDPNDVRKKKKTCGAEEDS
ncbi:hypothetical protein WA171_002078 [Blastocystis sp. BT1]